MPRADWRAEQVARLPLDTLFWFAVYAHHRIAATEEHIEKRFAGMAMRWGCACRRYLAYVSFKILNFGKGKICRRISAVLARMDAMLRQILNQKPLLGGITERLNKGIKRRDEIWFFAVHAAFLWRCGCFARLVPDFLLLPCVSLRLC